MQRFELQIRQARSESQNKGYSLKAGIPQQDFVSWGNEAQQRIYSEAIKTHPKYFMGEIEIDVVSAQEAYDLPEEVFLSHIEMVEYTISGQAKDYYRLDQAALPERIGYPVGNPGYYIRRGKQILMVPAPQTGGPAKIRINFVKKLPKLDVRRAVVQTPTVVGGSLTALTLDPASLIMVDWEEFSQHNFMCIVDRNGNIKTKDIEYDSVNLGTGVVTLTGSHSMTDQSIAAGDFVVLGQNTANISLLPETAERYIVEWLTFRATFRDGSSRSKDQKALCDEILQDVVASFADIDHDVFGVTLLNTDYLDAQRLDIIF